MDRVDSSVCRPGPADGADNLKVKASEDDMWGTLLQEELVEIFSRLPFEDRLRLVPKVCKGWRKASYDPTCWTAVDMGPWIRRRAYLDFEWESGCQPKVEHLVKAVVDRSCGQLRELRTEHISDGAIDYIAERCPSLVVLSIPNSPAVTDKSALRLASMIPRLEQLDVSDCPNISKQALEAFGDNCPSLTWLGRNMLTLDLNNQNPMASSSGRLRTSPSAPGGDDEAEVVSKHMGKLKHLEVKKGRLSDRGLWNLVVGCRELEDLDLACCTALSPQAVENASRNSPMLQNFRKPITPRMNVVAVNSPAMIYDD